MKDAFHNERKAEHDHEGTNGQACYTTCRALKERKHVSWMRGYKKTRGNELLIWQRIKNAAG